MKLYLINECDNKPPLRMDIRLKFTRFRLCFTSLCFLVFTLGSSNMIGQFSAPVDTSFKISKKKFIPLVESIASNALINRINVWVQDADWARISLQSWGNNIKHGFESDGDKFGTNFLLHPLQGSLYYNAARSCGYSYWQSIPNVVVGSFMWEFLGETQYASEIDVNTTTLGGVYLGEISYRLTRSLTNNHDKRRFKPLRKITAFLINPLSQINSWLYRDVKQYLNHKNYSYTPIRSMVGIGANLPYGNILSGNLSTRFQLSYQIEYGDLFSRKSKYTPFDFFYLKSWLNFSLVDEENPLFFNLTSHAPIARFKLNNNSIFCISQHFDFLHNHIFQQGDLCVTADYIFKKTTENINLITSVRAGLTLFGSTSSEIIDFLIAQGKLNTDRDYIYGRGFAFDTELLLSIKKLGELTISYNTWFLYTQRDAIGTEYSQILKINHRFPVYKGFSIGTEFYTYHRQAKYPLEGFQSISKGYSEFRLLGNYSF